MNSLKLRKKIDPIAPTIGIGLSILGLVMILSASQIVAADRFGDPYYFFTRQLVAWFIGMAAYFFFSKIKLERLFEARSTLIIIALVALTLVFFPVIGGEIKGVYRWVSIGPINFQPSEFAKLFLLIYLAGMFAVKGEKIKSFSMGAVPFIVVIGAVLGLIALGKDLDTIIVISIMGISMFYAAKAKISHVLLVLVLGVAAATALVVLEPYRLERLTVFLGNDKDRVVDIRNEGYHARQAEIAIGSGGMWGKGFGQGISKYKYLPESYTDSIFAVIAEELGFIRTILILIAFFILTWRGLIIANIANSKFAQLLAVGISVLIISQVLINVGGMLKIIPLSGLPLPFVSYGGSSLIASLAMLGLLSNISRERR